LFRTTYSYQLGKTTQFCSLTELIEQLIQNDKGVSTMLNQFQFKSIRIAGIAAIGVFSSLVIAGSALANSGSFRVSPGGRVCLLPTTYVTQSVRAEGTADQTVRFIVQQGTDANATQTRVDEQEGTAFAIERSRSLNPELFPGYFKVCARNVGNRPATVNLAINGN
jgi:hypothetical protein